MIRALAMAALLVAAQAAPTDDYRAEVERWRQERERTIRAEDGWLTVVGLHWLRPGETRIGGDPGCDVVLPAGAPAEVGTLTLGDDGRATFRPAEGVAVTRDGRPFAGGAIRHDGAGKPEALAVGDLRLILLRRGGRYALRVKDNRSAARAAFAGLRWFPVDPSWRVVGRFEPYPVPKTLAFETIVGERQEVESPGEVTFERDGQAYRLQAAVEDGRLWFVFHDATSGRTTHPGARQLLADPPRDGAVVLDFNRATNLPCAYTPYATCPLPPRQNRLALAIPAGEKTYEPGPRPPASESGAR